MSLRFFTRLLLSVALLCCNLAIADEIQDANKLFKQGQTGQAMEKVDDILSSKPKDAQARFLKGLIFTEQGKTAEAIKVFSALTEDYPELPEPYNNLAVLYAGQGQYEKAKIALESAIRTHPSYATAHENLGDIYAKMASQAYDRALQLDKSNASTATKLQMINDLFGDNNRKTASASRNVITATPAAAGTTPAAHVSAAPPAAATPAPKLDPKEEILKTVNAWAAAWAAKDSKKYLSFYDKEFKSTDGLSRSSWEKQRKERLAAPKSIHVELQNTEVKVADNAHATVHFRQIYRASNFHANSRKYLTMVKSNDKWLIMEEEAGR